MKHKLYVAIVPKLDNEEAIHDFYHDIGLEIKPTDVRTYVMIKKLQITDGYSSSFLEEGDTVVVKHYRKKISYYIKKKKMSKKDLVKHWL